MVSILSGVWELLLFNLIQLIAGLALSIALYKFGSNYLIKLNTKSSLEMIFIVLSALLGIALPLGIYGIIPVVAVLITLEIKTAIITPFIVSNAFFNMLLPYTDISFTWRNGMKRIILAVIAGILAGIVLKALKSKKTNLFKNRIYLLKGPISVSDRASHLFNNLGILISYLILGAFADIIFKSYAYERIMNLIFSNPVLGSVPTSLTSLNVTNPFSILSLKIADILMDFVKLSALWYLFRLRGCILYYVYYSLIASILAVSIFFR